MAREKHIEILPPRENALLFGHQEAEARFMAEFDRGLVHHAYLMTGPKGIGKATLAFRFARYVLKRGALAAVQEEPSLSLFGEPEPAPTPGGIALAADDPLFRRIAAGSHTDLLTLSPAYDAKKHVEKTYISVDEAREVPQFLSLTPAEGEWRVVIVDAVDNLNPQSANALLKTIEEPPPRAILFLVCHSPGGILPTIRSRCRQFKLAAPDVAAFGEVLSHVAPHIPNHEYAGLHALSHGSPGQAISLHAEDALQWYTGWLAAMQPDATPAKRQQFADSAGNQKSPASWAAVLHTWEFAMQRLGLHAFSTAAPIIAREEAQLAAILAATTPEMRTIWEERGRALIRQTDTFHLDKKQTIRLLSDPAQLDMMAA
jgi:DNA polymerase-3 subunit delta'